MNSQIAKTGLWAKSLGSKDADQEIERKKELLRSVLLRFREHASVVTSRISATFPELTVHDVTHLNALWGIADLIAGENYPLNPLEAFVFGGAILLHDAAHCFEAYEGGRLAVRSTLAWRDALASEMASHPNEPREKLEQYCDFTAIRLLHARQAEKLGEREWKSENGPSSFFLIEDTDLRSRYGALIGQIAASHNWSIDDVKSRLRGQVNAPGNWPSEWRVHFVDGLTLRPILAKGADENYDLMSSTSVRLTINEPIESIKIQWHNKGNVEHERQIPLGSYLAAITAALDFPVMLQIENEPPVSVHQPIDSLDNPDKILDWIKGITFVDVPGFKEAADAAPYVQGNAERLRRIEHDGRVVGLAALIDRPTDGLQCFTTDTIGGLTNQVVRGAGVFLGYMESLPATAKRDPSGKRVATTEALQSWANEQLSILKKRGATVEQLYWAASNLSNADLDPIDAISFPVLLSNNQYVLMPFEDIFRLLQQTQIACLKSRRVEFAETNIQPIVIDNLPTLRPASAGNLIRLEMEGGRPKHPFSLLGCLDRLLQQRDRELTYEVKPLPLKTMLGPMDALFIRLKDV